MLSLDNKSQERLKSPRTKTEDKLYLVARHLEEKYQLHPQPNHWEDAFGKLTREERVFYKLWLWLCYVEWESLVAPIAEFEEVYGLERRQELLAHLSAEQPTGENIYAYYQLDGLAGVCLLEWGMANLLQQSNK
ncbi:MAG: hypothetical protein AAFV25_27385 [Bacteroidota bacterium]